MLERVVLETFMHNGMPSYRSAGEVAEELGNLASQAVTSALKEAHSRGLFEVKVYLPEERKDIVRLQEKVRKKFRLEKVLLVPGYPRMVEELKRDEHRRIHSAVIRSMADRVAPYLDELIAAAAKRRREAAAAGEHCEPYRIGVAWGQTLHNICEELLTSHRKVRLKEVEVLPIIGITSTLNTEPVEANVVAMDMARAYGGVSAQLPAPAFVLDMDSGADRPGRQVREMLAKIRSGVDIVITSMGPVIGDGSDAAADITLSNDPVMNRELIDSARAAGAVGNICYWLYNKDGDEVFGAHKVIGLGLANLHRIAQDPNRRVILVAGGDRRRLYPLKVLLRRRYANVLVSDTYTARYLVGEIDLPPGCNGGAAR